MEKPKRKKRNLLMPESRGRKKMIMPCEICLIRVYLEKKCAIILGVLLEPLPRAWCY